MNVEPFVEEIKSHPEIYDRNHLYYNDRERKQKLFDQFSKKFNLNAKLRWKTLRDRYLREKKKLGKMSETQINLHKKWRYYSELTFLENYLNPTKRVSNDENFIDPGSENHNNTDIVHQSSHKYETLHGQNTDEVHLGNKCGVVFLEKGNFYFFCEYCYQVFVDAQFYMNHTLTYHSSGEHTNFNNIAKSSSVKETEEIFNNFNATNTTRNMYKPEESQKDYLDSLAETSVSLPTANNFEFQVVNQNINKENHNLLIPPPNTSSVIADLKITSMTNQDKQYACSFCDKTYTIYKSLMGHLRLHHRFRCNFCNEIFSSLVLLENHLSTNHQNAIEYEDDSFVKETMKSICSDDPQILNTNCGNKFICSECNLPFEQYEILQNHLNTVHNIINSSNSTIDQNTLTTNSTFNSTLPFIPEKIQNEFGKFICTVCDQTYTRYRSMKLHYFKHHLGIDVPTIKTVRPQCEICDKTFASKFGLEVHMNSHNNIRPYKCNFCTADFISPRYLEFHIRMHTGEKRYRCTYCSKDFIRQYDKVLHERSMHTGEKPYQCDDCGKTFLIHWKMVLHKNKMHNSNYTPPTFKCEICQKSFSNMNSLKHHSLIHTNEKPYQCKICFATFRKNDNLKSHEQIHEELKSYACKICNKRFSQRPGLYSHLKIHNIMPPTEVSIDFSGN